MVTEVDGEGGEQQTCGNPSSGLSGTKDPGSIGYPFNCLTASPKVPSAILQIRKLGFREVE